MPPIIKVLNEDRIKNIDNCIYKIRKGFPVLYKNSFYKTQNLYHYTSFEKLFNILEGDALWASRSRFSNDSTEDMALGENWIKQEQYYGDNYILCFCDTDDILSQWRGYCPQGGASICFSFPSEYSSYTLLHNDYDETSATKINNFEIYKNRPMPVVYCKSPQTLAKGIETDDLIKFFEDPKIQSLNISSSDMAPYLKNGYFYEEREFRLVFDNSNGELSKCIRFRKLKDGSRVPFIVVKYGDIIEGRRLLSLTYDKTAVNNLFKQNITNRFRTPIIIPFGKDQEDICIALSRKIKEHKKELFKDDRKYVELKRCENNPIQIICEGHLPIVSITVSPAPNQEYMKEVIERFCKSKYWLQNVEVKCSKIPYIAPKL